MEKDEVGKSMTKELNPYWCVRETIGEKPSARAFHSACIADGKMFIVGGSDPKASAKLLS